MPFNAANIATEKLLRQQSSLAAFGTFAFREENLQIVLTEAARICAESLGVPFCKVCRYRAETHDLLIVAGVGWHGGVVGRVISRADESSPQGRAFSTGQPVIIKNLQAVNDIVLPDFYAEHGIVSTIDVPIQTQSDTPYGVLEIDCPFEHEYDQHDIAFLTGFTNVLAQAVATAERMERLRQAVAQKDALIAEKNMLALELQHRVRNNLHIVYTMLTGELGHGDGGQRPEGIAAIARRVMTMSRVYDHLMGTGMARTIDFGAYIASLCQALPDTQPAEGREIEVSCDADPVLLDLDMVTALGMAVAELIANSYKHAFPSHRGTITVTLRHVAGGGQAVLTVSDDGVGMPAVIKGKRHGLGLAMRLVEQVAGTLTWRGAPGTSWEMVFPVPALA